MSLDTWVSLAALAAGLAGMYAALRREFRTEMSGLRTELKGDIGELRTELKGDIGELRTELKQDLRDLRSELRADFKSDLSRLDDRIYALAGAMRPPWEQKRAD